MEITILKIDKIIKIHLTKKTQPFQIITMPIQEIRIIFNQKKEMIIDKITSKKQKHQGEIQEIPIVLLITA